RSGPRVQTELCSQQATKGEDRCGFVELVWLRWHQRLPGLLSLARLIVPACALRTKVEKPGIAGLFYFYRSSYLCRLNVLGLEALGAAHDVELNALTFLTAAET